MARAYRMTPARRAALKRAQLASARKRKGHGRVGTHLRKHKAKYAAGIAIAAVAAGAAASHGHNKRTKRTIHRSNAAKPRPQGKMVTVYHRTHSKHVPSIKKHGLRGSSYGHGVAGHGQVHFSTDKHYGRVNKRRYGDTVVTAKVSRHHLKKDHNEPGAPYVTAHPKHITGVKVAGKKRAKVSHNSLASAARKPASSRKSTKRRKRK